MKIVIEATAKKLILQGGILRSRATAETYHFKQVTHPDSIKIYVCHTASYCAQHSNLTCACTTSVDVSDFRIYDVALRGNNNELYLGSLGMAGGCSSFSMDGKQNNVEMRISGKRLSIVMSGMGAAQGEHHLTLAGIVEELAISSTRYFGLNAEHLTVVTSALITCHGQDLIKVMLEPRVLSGDFRVRNEAAPTRPTPPAAASTSTTTTTTPQTAAASPPPQSRRKRAPKESSATKRTRLPADSHATCIAHKEEMRLQACSICLENVPNWVCVPCGHMLCPRCTSLLCNKLKPSSTQLLLCSQAGCNQKVEQVVRAILPFSSSSSSSSSHTKPTLLSGSLSPTDMETISLDDE